MIGRTMVLAGGLTGAAAFSQFPEYSQQYTQRLGGAVDALAEVVADFDADAAEVGLSREAALVDLAQGGQMGAQRAETMVETIDRHRRLADDLAALREAGPFTRAAQAGRFMDAEIARAAWADYKPALPLTFEGGVFAALGFAGFGLMLAALIAALRGLFRRRQPDAGA